MDSVFETFRKAQAEGNGYLLSETISPIAPSTNPDQLYSFYKSTNFASVKNDFKYRILYDNKNPFKLSSEEGNAWVDIYVAYWKAVGEILNAETANKKNLKVFI